MADYRINYGQIFNYYNRVAVSRTNFGTAADGYIYDCLIPFSTAGFSFLNEGTTTSHVVEYSFDGVNVHGEINPTLPNRYSKFDHRVACKIWFRVKSGSTGPITIAVEAWAIR